MVDMILSVKSEYADRILDGVKRFEFRTQRPRRQVSRVYIYATSPRKRIVGCFRLIRVLSGSPEEIWETCGNHGGIEKEKFFSFFGNSEMIYGFEVGYIERFNPPIDPFKMNCDFRAPQSFAYVYDIDEIGLNGESLPLQISK
ncbi:MAG: ASCH domain-containing protein [Methanomicrobia archaeon]|nr:ASCH domain-containing protein [Methanomicrobia archaeon]